MGLNQIIQDGLAETEKKLNSQHMESMAKATIKAMQKDCLDCEALLLKKISQKDSGILDRGSKKGNLSDSEINVLIANKDQLKSRSLISNLESYQATKRLHATLLSNERDPVKKLENYNAEYNKKDTSDALRSNPDSRVVQFFKKAGYLLSNFFTLGTVHILTKGSPIMSPQQQLHKRSQSKINAAAHEGLIKKRTP